MCLGIPGKVVWIEENVAGVDFGDVLVEAGTHVVEDIMVGDYVLVHSGNVLEKLDHEDAQKTLALFEELNRFQVRDNIKRHWPNFYTVKNENAAPGLV